MFLFCSYGVKPDRAGVRGDLLGPSWKDRQGRAKPAIGNPKCLRRERKQYPMLIAYSQGVRRMGLVESKRPVVLIVEDEFLLRMDAVDMIGAAGFEVAEAANADQAIEILESRFDITVVFTDIQMPGSMDGLKLARAVRGRWPPIKIVATSGHVGVRETDLPDGGRFLPKPYSPMQVTGVLRELTGGG
jgi:CheY-like chemotaxis protein